MYSCIRTTPLFYSLEVSVAPRLEITDDHASGGSALSFNRNWNHWNDALLL